MNAFPKVESVVWLSIALLTLIAGLLYQSNFLAALTCIAWLSLSLSYALVNRNYQRPTWLVIIAFLSMQIAYFSFFGLALSVVCYIDQIIFNSQWPKLVKMFLLQIPVSIAAFLVSLPLALISHKIIGKYVALFSAASVIGPFVVGIYLYGFILLLGMSLALLVTRKLNPNKFINL